MGVWSITDRLAEVSVQGDPPKTLSAAVDFEMFRPVLETAPGRPPRWKDGRPSFDPVLKIRILVLQSLHGLSLEQTGHLVRDRLSTEAVRQLGSEDRVPDANTLWDFREALIAAGGLDDLFELLDWAITAAGYLPRGGQIGDASPVAAPRQRNADGETAEIRGASRPSPSGRTSPPKARQKDVDGRWTVKYSKVKVRADGTKPVDLAIPVYGHKTHVSIDRMHGIVRRQIDTDAARHDGARRREGPIARTNTSRSVRADNAYRPAENEAWPEAQGMESRIHRKTLRGRPMPQRTRRANAVKSAVRSRVEHVFAQQKARTGMTIRTIGLARAQAAITLANMTCYSPTRWRRLDSRPAPA